MESGPWGMCFDGRLDLCVPFLQVFAPGTKLCTEMSGDILDYEKEPGAENLVVEYVGAENMVVVYVDTLSTCLPGVVDRHGEECWQGAAAKCPESGVEMHGSGAQCEDTAMSGASPIWSMLECSHWVSPIENQRASCLFCRISWRKCAFSWPTLTRRSETNCSHSQHFWSWHGQGGCPKPCLLRAPKTLQGTPRMCYLECTLSGTLQTTEHTCVRPYLCLLSSCQGKRDRDGQRQSETRDRQKETESSETLCALGSSCSAFVSCLCAKVAPKMHVAGGAESAVLKGRRKYDLLSCKCK